MVEYSERFSGKANVKVGTCDGRSSEVRKHFPGVSKKGNKWQAQIRHPKLKFEVYLGYYSTPEEAAFVVKKKKAEYEDIFKGEDSVNVVETCSDGFEGRKLPSGVRRRGNRSWEARVWHPGLKSNVYLGSYKTVEEAAVAVDNKRAEFRKMYACRMGVKQDFKDDDKVLEQPECEVVSTSECSDVQMSADVKELESGKWEARISHPVSRVKIWLGTCDTAEEAIRSLNSKKSLLAAKRKRVEFDECEFRYKGRPDCEAVEATVKLECDLGHICPPSVLGAGYLDDITVDEKLRYGVSDIPGKLEYTFSHISRSSIVEPESSNADIDDRSVISKGNQQKTVSDSDFDEAVSSGFINEYGQLLGKYSELDEQLRFSLPDEDIEATGCYFCPM